MISTTGSTTPHTILGSTDGRAWSVLGEHGFAPSAASEVDVDGATARYVRYLARADVRPEVSTLAVFADKGESQDP